MTQRKWVYEGIYAALFAVAAGLVLSPVLRHSGWPLNEGTAAPLLLVQMYAAHIRHLDLIPVWSSSDEFGLGSPVLLFYHRLFFYLAGLLTVFGVGLKASVILTLVVFLAVGAYGMRRSLGLVTDNRLLSTVGSLGFLFTNYAFTDWLDPRGDLAEFSAMMIVPWLLYWCLNLVKNRRVSYVLIPVMVLLVNAHSAIALLSLFTLAISFVTFLILAKLPGLRAVAKRLVVSAAASALLLAPILVAQLRFLHSYDPQTKNASDVKVSDQFLSFGKYFYDSTHRWFSPNQYPPWHNSVQIDFAIWIPIVAAMAVVIWRITTTTRRRDRRRRLFDSVDRPVLFFLLVSLAVYVFLQLRASYFVYRLFSPLMVINFPWRMLVFITPIGIILVVLIADHLARSHPQKIVWGSVAGLWLASLILLSPITSKYGLFASPRPFSPMASFTAPKYVDYRSNHESPLYDVFLPKYFAANGHEIDAGHELIDYAVLHTHQSGARSLSSVPCTVLGPPHAEFETLSLTFSVSCGGRTRVALPISYNDYSSVFVEKHGGSLRQIPYFHVRTDPRIVISVPSSGRESVVVHLPTLWGTLF